MSGLRYAQLARNALMELAGKHPALNDPEARMDIAERAKDRLAKDATDGEQREMVEKVALEYLDQITQEERTAEPHGEFYVINLLKLRKGHVVDTNSITVSVPDRTALEHVERNLAEDASSEIQAAIGESMMSLSNPVTFEDIGHDCEIVFYQWRDNKTREAGRVAAGFLKEKMQGAGL